MKSNFHGPTTIVCPSTSSKSHLLDPDSKWIGRMAPKRSRRDAILQSVGTVLRNSRLSCLTMQDVADQLGITKGNLYYYFKSKQDILFQCHMRCMDLSLAALHEIQAAPSRQIDPLQTLLVRHITGMLENGFGGVLLTDLENLTPVQRRHYVARRDEFESGVRQFIDAGVRQGIYVCEDAKLASLIMLGSINWLPKWYRPDGDLAPKELATGIASFLMKSLQHKDAKGPTSKKQVEVSTETQRPYKTARTSRKPNSS